MRKIFNIAFLISIFLLLLLTPTLAQEDHTAREEKEGKTIWDKLQQKKVTCDRLSEEDFERLGEYFMGQMVGNSHEAMNNMMEQMIGKEGEEQMHVVMGKRLSGCDSSATFPSQGAGFLPMMGMMGSAGSPQVGGRGNPMMSGWGDFSVLGWLSMLLFWGLLILGIIVLIRYLARSSKEKEKKPLDILKERYAKGEINKKEFEQMRKELT